MQERALNPDLHFFIQKYYGSRVQGLYLISLTCLSESGLFNISGSHNGDTNLKKEVSSWQYHIEAQYLLGWYTYQLGCTRPLRITILALSNYAKRTIVECATRKRALVAVRRWAQGILLKGFEYDRDKYVVVTDDEFEKIKTEKDRTIQILHFTDLKTIKPIYFEKTYHAVPEAGGEKAFELLRTAMMQEGKIAIAKTVIGTKETLLAIMPTDEGIMVETMYYADEIKDIPKAYAHPEVNEAELNMAKTLIGSMDQPFEPDKYHDEYQERLRQLIEQKIAGKEIVAAKPEGGESNIIDLMEALKASVDKINEDKEPPKKRGRKKSS